MILIVKECTMYVNRCKIAGKWFYLSSLSMNKSEKNIFRKHSLHNSVCFYYNIYKVYRYL